VPSQRELDALRRALEEERLARLALVERVERMQAQLEGMQPTRQASRFEGDADRASETAEQRLGVSAGEAGINPHARARFHFDPTKLEGAGIHAAEADRLGESYDEMEMERLELRRLYKRGEIEAEELSDAETAIRDRYRTELGDEAYDLMLYAGWESNRVGVADVMHDSPAQAVGLQPGDVILSYAGERLFAPSDLVRATIEEDPGGSVPIVVLREGEEHHFSVPTGPLGVVISERRGEPYP
jgi:membrane-associated protease RseP (regulator of RpoE activity)